MTIRIFVGCSANGEDAEAQAMLEYTLRSLHKGEEPISIEWMMLSRDPASPWYSNPQKREGWNTQKWATPFSAFRWAIPAICNFEGKAIYMDVDMIALDDIEKLWNQPMGGAAILMKDDKHSCVMLIDCARAKAILPDLKALKSTEGLYRNVRKNLSQIARFENNWNCLDGENYKTLADPDIKVIHFTKVETQPHLKYALPRLKAKGKMHWNTWTLRQDRPQPHARSDVQPLVDRLWAEAQAAGYTTEKYETIATNFGAYDAVRGGARAA